jgi:hypothetical protein
MGNVDTLDSDLRVLGEKLSMCKAQRITVHLAEGLKLAGEAKSIAQVNAAHSRSEAALAEFQKALEVDEADLDALEYAAKQARLLNLRASLQTYLDKMEVAAREQGRPSRQARALRLQAELLEERSAKSALRDARTKLETALKVLDVPDAQDKGEEKLFELALVNEQLGSLHLRRGTPTLVRPHLDSAKELYKKMASQEGSAGLLRIEKLFARFAKVEQGGDEPEEVDETGDGVLQMSPTHVTLDNLNVFEAPGGSGAVVQKLMPFTAVTMVEGQKNWALIAKNGEPLGYVAKAKLRELH